MKAKFSRKIGRRGKIGLAILIALMFVSVATAALLPYYGRIQTTATISQSVLLDGEEYTEIADDIIVATAGDTAYTEHTIQNDATVEAPIQFVPPTRDEVDIFFYLLELQTKNLATADWSGAEHTDSDRGVSAHLKTTGIAGPTGVGDEARVHIDMPRGTTLADIEEISWWEYLVAGYPPHVDVIIDYDGNNDGNNDALVFEYAFNGHTGDTQPTYGALTSPPWYQTFSDDGEGPGVVDDNAIAWLSSELCGTVIGTLAEWKAENIVTGINGDTTVIAIEIEIDNWMINTEAYVDDIQIKGPPQRLDFTLSPLTMYGLNLVYIFDVATLPDTYNYWIRIDH